MLFYFLLGGAIITVLYFGIRERDFFILFLTALLSAFGLLFYVFGMSSILYGIAPHQETQYQLNLAALADRPAETGQFFLCSGQIKNKEIISYVYGDNKHGYHPTHAPAEQSTIYQDSSEAGSRVVVTYHSGYNWWLNPFHWTPNFATTYDFHVPLGSVSGEFEVDSE